MITKIYIENFKGIGSPGIEIELKPITLLFGGNSAGKSTIIQALHYAREILKWKNPNPKYSEIGGKSVNLGGFKNFVHNHDLSRSIILKFDLDLKDYSFTELENSILNDPIVLSDLMADVKFASVELEIKWDNVLDRVFVEKFSVFINNKKLVQLNEIEKNIISISDVNFFNDIFNYLSIDDNIFARYNWIVEKNYILKIDNLSSAIPIWQKKLTIEAHENFELDLHLTEPNTFDEELYYILQLVADFILSIGEKLTFELEKLLYIGPIRDLPDREFQYKKNNDYSRWANGFGAWDKLFYSDEKFINNANDWLKTKLDAGYSLNKENYRMLYKDSKLLDLISNNNQLSKEDLLVAINELVEVEKIVINDLVNNNRLSPFDVGIGISQILPVVVGALYEDKRIMTVEQPELHIHPKMQTVLADLFIEQINKPKNALYILETHSEHLMLRLLRRIEETTDGNLPDKNYQLKPEQIAVYFFESTKKGLKVTHIPIDETGEFTEQWPKGFFEERAEELFR